MSRNGHAARARARRRVRRDAFPTFLNLDSAKLTQVDSAPKELRGREERNEEGIALRSSRTATWW